VRREPSRACADGSAGTRRRDLVMLLALDDENTGMARLGT